MKHLSIFLLAFCLLSFSSVPASAVEYTMEAPGFPEYAKSTSVEPVITADRGERSNTDLSKNTALIPPLFGSPSSALPGSGEPLYSFLGSPSLIQPNIVGSVSVGTPPGGNGTGWLEPIIPAYGYTEVTEDMYYSGGYLGRVKIPTLDVNVKLYEGTDSKALSKGAGHFEGTSIWNGNICVAGHNRGANCYFGEIHTLDIGDKITLTTKLGTRTYSVVNIQKVKETDHSMLAATTDNCITLYTCVRNQSTYRWCVRAIESV